MNTLANSSEAHVEEIIKALKALPQCIKASAEATKMSTTSKVVKSRSKKERAKQEYGTEKAYSDTPQAIEIAGDDLCGTSQSRTGKVASRLALHRWSLLAREVSRLALNKSSAIAGDILMRKVLTLGTRRE
jgi:hypothetical protein